MAMEASHKRPATAGAGRMRGLRVRWMLLLSLMCGLQTTRLWLSPPRRSLLALMLGASNSPAHAFENRVKEVKGPKTPGPKPAGVGQGQIAGCGAAPNCDSTESGFSSAAADEDHYLKPWAYPSGGQARAMRDLEKALKSYPVGQQDIDGGGFEIQTLDAEKGYAYVQFESLKRGYIDDVEFRVTPKDSESGEVFVRSASRVGYLDLGVNAKRLNQLSQQLRELGWTAPKITADLFPRYVSENR
ncbi:unnamed protein product [Durusdinium trenchii]|uniref:DUF1499 domain-containing protein n=1 Tax=Durusdinium trenchii TaxID=1381693 RepID=A0ABP0PWK9_9DINO